MERKLSDHIFVNGEQRFFVASEVTDDLMEKIREEIQYGGITDIEEGSENVHVTMSPDGQKASIAVDETSIEIDENLDTESQNPVENRAVAEAMNGKQDQLTEMTDQEINDLINSLGDL